MSATRFLLEVFLFAVFGFDVGVWQRVVGCMLTLEPAYLVDIDGTTFSSNAVAKYSSSSACSTRKCCWT